MRFFSKKKNDNEMVYQLTINYAPQQNSVIELCWTW